MYLPKLSEQEQKLIADLLCNHTNEEGTGIVPEDPLSQLGARVAEYLDEKGLLQSTDPLPLRISPSHPYGDRVMIQWIKDKPGETK